MTFGDRVKAILIFKKITQREFAETIGVCRDEMNKLLNNRKKPNTKELMKIIEVLNVPYDCLIGKVELFDEMLLTCVNMPNLW